MNLIIFELELVTFLSNWDDAGITQGFLVASDLLISSKTFKTLTAKNADDAYILADSDSIET